MSLSGGAAVVVYYIVCLFTRKTLSTQVRYNLLKAAMVLFIFPFPEFKYLLPVSFLEILESKMVVSAAPPAGENMTMAGYGKKVESFGGVFSWICLIGTVFLVGVSVFLQIKRYRRIKSYYRANGSIFDIHDYIDNYEEIKRRIGIRRNIQFMFSDCCTTPLTIGVFAPIIVFPESIKEHGTEEWFFLLSHELNHIKANDFVTNFLGYVICWMHIANPAVHLLYRELRSICEIHCDNRTTKEYDGKARERYCCCIVGWARNTKKRNTAMPLGFAGVKSSTLTKRRILEMNQPKQKKRLIPFLAALAIGVTGSTAVLAYDPANEFEILSELHPDYDYYIMSMSEALEKKAAFENQIVYIDGNEEGSNAERVICFHSYEEILAAEHKLNSDGSCETRYYTIKQCTKCGTIKNKEFTRSIYEIKCPH